MCYFTKKVLNKRFLPNRKNGWNPPVCTDERFRYVEVECGHCFECRKKKRREWRIRNYEQLKETPHAVFFTGTVSPVPSPPYKESFPDPPSKFIVTGKQIGRAHV